MARYVNAEECPKLFDDEYKKTRKLIENGETHLDNLAEGFTEAHQVIMQMPTADVVEVRHSSYDIEGFCKICETPIPVTSKQGLIPVRTVRYCHYCGAKMDLRVKGDKG